MNVEQFNRWIVQPGVSFLEDVIGLPPKPESNVLLLAIAGIESGWQYRAQFPVAYAHSFWQFEMMGGVAGVLSHPASAAKIRQVCAALSITCDVSSVYQAMTMNDLLACAMARLYLWTDPRALPAVGDQSGAWNYYVSIWRPGRPRPQDWPANYQAALAIIRPEVSGAGEV